MAEVPINPRVLDLSRGVAGGYAVRLLTDLGATSSRWLWSDPRPGAWPDDPLFRDYFADGVEECARRVPLHDMLAAMPRLALEFDIVVTDFTASELAFGELFGRLSETNPAIIVANADHFGRSGPYAHWTGDELTDWAMGGYWAIGGDPAREPIRVPGYQAQFHAGMHLALAILAARRYALRTGAGQEIEVTGMEAVLGAHWSTTVAWTHEGRVFKRAGPDLFRAADGWVFFYRLGLYRDLFVLIGQPELADEARFATIQGWIANGAALWAIVEGWCADKPVDQIVEAAQALRIPVTPMADAERLLSDPELAARGFFREVEGVRFPGPPYRWPGGLPERRPPERLAALLTTAPGVARTPPIRRAAAAASGPALAGLRVLELTNNWAGPIAGRHLADLGAEVIKVEIPDRPATRGSHYPGKEPGKYFWNRSGYFNEMNRNKRSVALNLAHPSGRELFVRLVEGADVVIQNNSARVMPNLGLSYETLRAANPRLVMVSISGFGATGPRRDWLAYGSNIEAACGLAAMTGYSGEEVPYRTGSFVGDPIAGAHAAIAVLAALEQRDRTGDGCHIDIALTESSMPFMLLGFTHFQRTGTLYARGGNADPWDAPAGAYRCFGTDDWVAIAARTDAQWQALAALASLEGATWTRAQRLAARPAIDTAISAWTADLEQYECVRELQAAGIPSAPILHNYQLHSDPHLHARRAFIPIEHPDTGVMPYPGFPWQLSATPSRVRSAAPRFAEGNAYVFGELLGLPAAQMAQLYAEGVTAATPSGLSRPLLS